MKKLLLASVMMCGVVLNAKMIDGVAMVVEGEPVTTSEIVAVQKQYHLPKAKAINLLIRDRLQKATIDAVTIPEEVIDQKISEVAAKNGVSVAQMQEILQQRGTEWSSYRDSVAHALKKEKFFQENVLEKIPTPTEDELKLYYKHHQSAFTLPTSIEMVEYSSDSREAIKNFLQTHRTDGVTTRKVTQKTNTINPALLSALMQTPVGAFTRPFNAGDRYIIYKVIAKKGTIQIPYRAAREGVLKQWQQTQQNKALQDYFEKLRTRADVQIIRR